MVLKHSTIMVQVVIIVERSRNEKKQKMWCFVENEADHDMLNSWIADIAMVILNLCNTPKFNSKKLTNRKSMQL